MKRTQALSVFKWLSYAGIYGGLLLPLVFLPVVIFPFVFSKLIFFQIVVGVTFPAYLALAWMEPKYRPPKHLLYFGLIGYFIAMALSVVFAIDPWRAWWGNQERMNGLFTLLHFFAWLTMATGMLKRWADWRRLLNYQVILSGIMAVVAILQKIKPDLLLFPAGPRVGGLLDNPIYMAAYQIFNLFFLVLLFLKVKNRNWRIAYGAIAFLDIIAFVLAQSRGALVGLAAGIVAFGIFAGLFAKKRKLRLWILSGVGMLFAVYAVLFAFRDLPMIANSPLSRLLDFRASVSTRLIAWDIAWEGFLERPLTGWGLDNFHILFNEKYHPESLRFGTYETWFDRAHNTVLDVLSMTGLFGFLTFAFIYIALFYSIWRAYKKGWLDLWFAAILTALPVAYFVQNLFVFDHPAGFSMSYLLFAFVIAATRGMFVGEPEEEAKTASARTHAAPWIAFGVLQLAALLLVWRASVLPFQASRLAIKSNSIISASPQRALQYAEQARAIWTPYLDEQSFLMSRNLITLLSQGGVQRIPNWEEMYAFTKEVSEEEISRHPRNTHTRFIYARLAHSVIQLKPEEAAVAEQQYLVAIDTSPKRQQLYDGLSRLYLQTGKTQDALDLLQRSRDFDPELGEGYWNYGIVLFYDLQDYAAGADQIIKSQTAPYPYYPSEPREIMPLFDAYIVLGNEDDMRAVIERLPHLPKASADLYAQLALKFQIVGKPELRDRLLEVATELEPGTPAAFERAVQAQQQRQATEDPSDQ